MTTQSIEGAMPPLPERNKLMTMTAPRAIFLNVFTDDPDGEFPDNHGGITWCEDEAGDVDVPYIRLDIAIASVDAFEAERAPLLARVAELEKDAARFRAWASGELKLLEAISAAVVEKKTLNLEWWREAIDAALAAHKEQP